MIVEVVAVFEIEATPASLVWCQFIGNDQWQMTASTSGRLLTAIVTHEDGTTTVRTLGAAAWLTTGDHLVITVAE